MSIDAHFKELQEQSLEGIRLSDLNEINEGLRAHIYDLNKGIVGKVIKRHQGSYERNNLISGAGIQEMYHRLGLPTIKPYGFLLGLDNLGDEHVIFAMERIDAPKLPEIMRTLNHPLRWDRPTPKIYTETIEAIERTQAMSKANGFINVDDGGHNYFIKDNIAIAHDFDEWGIDEEKVISRFQEKGIDTNLNPFYEVGYNRVLLNLKEGHKLNLTKSFEYQ